MERIKRYLSHQSYEVVAACPKEGRSSSFSNLHDQQGIELYQPQPGFISLERVLIALLSISNIFLLVIFAIHSNSINVGGYNKQGINDDIKRALAYSPILDMYDLKSELRTLNGALRDNSSIWRQPPSVEVDAAWDYISAEGLELVTVSENDIIKSGKDPSIALTAPSSWGEGEAAYIVQVEVFHQIHCLNELRKEIHYDHYYKSPPTELHRSHKTHCLHMLLQSLMCTADVGIITHNWVYNENVEEPKIRPMADFNMVKKCADFEGILGWIREEKAVQDLGLKWPELRYVPGMKIVPGDGYAEKANQNVNFTHACEWYNLFWPVLL